MKRKPTIDKNILQSAVTRHVDVINDRAVSFLTSDENQVKGLNLKLQDIEAENKSDEAKEFLHQARVSNLQIETLYCSKTGRPIGTRHQSEIELLLKLHINTTPTSLLQFINISSGCSPAWIQTDSISLDLLQEADPYGYYMYAAGLICKRVTKAGADAHRKHFSSIEYQRDFQQSLAEGFAKLQSVPVARIIEANELWRKLLTLFSPQRVKWPFDWPEEYCTNEGVDYLFKAAERKIREIALKEHSFETYLQNVAIADAVRKAGGGTGLSNIAGQRKDKGDILDDILAKTFIETGVHFTKQSDGKVVINKKQAKPNITAMVLATEKRKSVKEPFHKADADFRFDIKISE